MVLPLLGAGYEGMTAPLHKLHQDMPAPHHAPEVPGHGGGHGGGGHGGGGHGGGEHGGGGHNQHEDPELEVLAHYIADQRLRKLMKIARKLGMDFRDPNFKKWLMDAWGKYVGQPVSTMRQLIQGLGSVAQNIRSGWVGWLFHAAEEAGAAWSERPKEGPPEDQAPFYNKRVGGYGEVPAGYNVPSRDFGGRQARPKQFASRMHRQQHRGGY